MVLFRRSPVAPRRSSASPSPRGHASSSCPRLAGRRRVGEGGTGRWLHSEERGEVFLHSGEGCRQNGWHVCMFCWRSILTKTTLCTMHFAFGFPFAWAVGVGLRPRSFFQFWAHACFNSSPGMSGPYCFTRSCYQHSWSSVFRSTGIASMLGYTGIKSCHRITVAQHTC
jgi:hypothetical protein